MSFTITLQKNLSPLNKVDKNITDIVSVTGNLRESSSITDPEILIESSLESNMLADVNYMHVSQFNRYYFITDIVLDITGLWLLTGHVDVLMSYKTGIKAQNAVVARQQRK